MPRPVDSPLFSSCRRETLHLILVGSAVHGSNSHDHRQKALSESNAVRYGIRVGGGLSTAVLAEVPDDGRDGGHQVGAGFPGRGGRNHDVRNVAQDSRVHPRLVQALHDFHGPL